MKFLMGGPNFYCDVSCSFRPRSKGRKSYARDSHGFELENNYFQGKCTCVDTCSDFFVNLLLLLEVKCAGYRGCKVSIITLCIFV